MLIKSRGDDHSHTAHHARSEKVPRMARSMELREPVAKWIYVVSVLLSRQRLPCSKNVATSRHLTLVLTPTQTLLGSLTSPTVD